MPTPYWNKIEKYWYFWFVENPGGRLFLKLEDGSTTYININDKMLAKPKVSLSSRYFFNI